MPYTITNIPCLFPYPADLYFAIFQLSMSCFLLFALVVDKQRKNVLEVYSVSWIQELAIALMAAILIVFAFGIYIL